MVKYGLFNFCEEPREIALQCYSYIQSDSADLKHRYISLGFHLNEFHQKQFFRDFGFDNLYDFAFDNFGLKQSAVSRCINVWQRFCLKQNGICKISIDDAYQDYNYSQLTEMLPLSDVELRHITPNMTVKQIRDFKNKGKKQKEKKKMDVLDFDPETFIPNLLPVLESRFDLSGYFTELKGKCLFIHGAGVDYKIMLSVSKS